MAGTSSRCPAPGATPIDILPALKREAFSSIIRKKAVYSSLLGAILFDAATLSDAVTLPDAVTLSDTVTNWCSSYHLSQSSEFSVRGSPPPPP